MACSLALCICSIDAQVGQKSIGEADQMQVCHGCSVTAIPVVTDGTGARPTSRRMSHARVKVGLRRPEIADREARTVNFARARPRSRLRTSLPRDHW
jgi:hypothetical protein